jgi:hypothetical protein
MKSAALKINLNPTQALDLEIKLNVSKYGHSWKDLGDILFAWRLSPEYYQQNVPTIPVPTTFSIDAEKMEWICCNICEQAGNNKVYTLKLPDFNAQ